MCAEVVSGHVLSRGYHPPAECQKKVELCPTKFQLALSGDLDNVPDADCLAHVLVSSHAFAKARVIEVGKMGHGVRLFKADGNVLLRVM